MSRLSAMLLIVLAVGAVSPAAAQDSELIGYTTITRVGSAGILVFNEDCDNRFPGVGAHICTSGDFIRGNLPTRPAPMLARMVTSRAALSGGRIVLGMGAGRVWERISDSGVARLAPVAPMPALGRLMQRMDG